MGCGPRSGRADWGWVEDNVLSECGQCCRTAEQELEVAAGGVGLSSAMLVRRMAPILRVHLVHMEGRTRGTSSSRRAALNPRDRDGRHSERSAGPQLWSRLEYHVPILRTSILPATNFEELTSIPLTRIDVGI